jgi:DNA-directed RNA polymerase specialized sigma24 family protein
LSEIDYAFEQTRAGDAEAFAAWVRLVEFPLRGSLRRFARAVDVEAVMQEGLLRMWRLAPALRLEGEDASLRFSLRLLHNLAVSEARRLRRFEPLDTDPTGGPPLNRVDPDPPSDPLLRRVIQDCIARLPRQPRVAILARLQEGGHHPDSVLAGRLNMKKNTFLQNVVRARKLLAKCLEGRGVRLEGMAS